MRLSFEQGRILGAMIEKAMTTPAGYPMSLNGVVVACNQVSNREPVTEFSDDEAELILRSLADDGLAKMVHRPGDRVVKYRQALDEQLQTTAQETALIAVLLLRGPQTPGELRSRTARYVEFVGLPELEAVLSDLGQRQLVRRLERRPGQKESRYQELLTADTVEAPPFVADPAESESTTEVPAVPEPAMPATLESADPTLDVAAELADLKRRFEILLATLGEEIP